jgi:hypothetical protein
MSRKDEGLKVGDVFMVLAVIMVFNYYVWGYLGNLAYDKVVEVATEVIDDTRQSIEKHKAPHKVTNKRDLI